MPHHKAPQVRSAIRFGLRSILDPELTKAQRERVRQFFQFECAFCARPLPPGTRSHMDHLISVAAGGTNHLSNRVLACESCNGNEKLEREWLVFLRSKSENDDVLRTRERRIREWSNANQPAIVLLPPDQQRLLNSETLAVVQAFDRAVERLRAARLHAG